MKNQATALLPKQSMRNSGVELLKLFAMFLIVTSHVIQTFGYDSPYIADTSYVVNYTVPSANIQHLIVAIFSFSGNFGNAVFFACSAWFLLESKKASIKKWFFLFVEIWVISVIILGITYLHRNGAIDKTIILHSFLPSTFGNNWYLSCYLLFYPIHTFLNKLIQGMSQTQLFRTAAILFLLYSVLSYLRGGLFFPSMLITWIMIYFVVAYIKYYREDLANNKVIPLTAFFLSAFAMVAVVTATNFLGLRYSFFSGRLLQGFSMSNPFLLICAVSLLLLAQQATHLKSRSINYLAKQTVLIYLIHENGILGTYYRPMLVRFCYVHFGYNYLLLEVFILASLVFTASLVISILYDLSVRRFVKSLSEKVCALAIAVWMKAERFCLSKGAANND